MISVMRIRGYSILLTPTLLLLAACGGGDAEPTPPGALATSEVATATPFATLPQPTTVTGPDTGTGGGAADDVTYTVEAGDAISIIATRFGVPEDVIREANGIEGNDIFIGQALRIPRSTGTGTGTGTGSPQATATPGTGGGASDGTYTVQPGDTALGIAIQFDVSLEALEQANGVGPGGLDELSLGQVLIIPPPD